MLLGECTSSRTAPTTIEAEIKRFYVDILPNPSSNYFNLVVNTSDGWPVSVRIRDVLGRIVEVKDNLPANGSYKFGDKLRGGIYFAEVVEGRYRKVIRLLKI